VLACLMGSGCGREPEPRVLRVGILCGTDAFLPIADGFRQGMAKLGYVEPRDIVYDVRSVNADRAALEPVARQFVEARVDLIFTIATEASLAAKAASRDTAIPVVFTYAGIEEDDLVESIREPGGNVTGVRYPGPEQITKRLEILLEMAPHVKRIWIGYDRQYPNAAPAVQILRPLAASRGVTLVEAPVDTLEGLAAELAARAAAADPGMEAMLLMPDTLNHSPQGWALIREFAAKHRVPVAGSFLYTVREGALFGNANDLPSVGALAAPLADKIFRGTPPKTIPVVTPEQELLVNYKCAQELGLQVPEVLLKQATTILR